MAQYWLFSGYTGLKYSRLKKYLSESSIIPYPDNHAVTDGQLKLIEGPCGIDQVDFLHIVVYTDTAVHTMDHNTYTIKARIMNLHDSNTIDNIRRKDKLHKSLKDSEYIAKTYNLNEFTYDGGVWIMRPSHISACSGLDIKIINSLTEFTAAKNYYETKQRAYSKFRKEHYKYYEVIVSEYIMRPMLIQGHKFHIRMFMITRLNRRPNIARNHGEILTAAEPYNTIEWSKKIHDTHFSSSIGDFKYPGDFPAQNMLPDINRQLDELEEELDTICRTHAPYKQQAKYSFQVFGLDIMVHETGKIVLIEINDSPGYAHHTKNTNTIDNFENNHCEWIWKNISDLF